MRPKLPSDIQILNVTIGTRASSSAGLYSKADANVTVRIEGDNAGLFRVTKVETDDVVIVREGPHGNPIEVLETALVVNGPGPIQVFNGQAILASVEFSCPMAPAQAAFRATAVMDGLPAPNELSILATPFVPVPPPLPTIQSPWAILLCKFSDNASEPFPRSFYENLFTLSGLGTMNMVDFFSDMSHGQLDLRGSKVFGWYTLSQKRSDYKGGGPNPAGRQALIDWAKQSATNAGVSLADYFNVVVCMNVQTDLFGSGGGAVCDNLSMTPSLFGQEMGHGYGLDHARANGSENDYQDPYDIMSTAVQTIYTPNSTYTTIGPGLNAANMEGRGWLDEARVWKSIGDFDQTIPLRPLHRHSLPGYLAARVGAFLVEYRAREFWDNNNQFPVVLVHRFQNNHSYIMPATDGRQGLFTGSVFQSNNVYFRHRVEVLQIDDQNKAAYVRLQFTALIRQDSRFGAGQLISDRVSDGGGYVLIGGHIVPIPPRSPAMALLEQAAALHAPETLENQALGEQVREFIQLRNLEVYKAGRGPFRQPARKAL
jgi:hypothetical protein